ncbi:MAG TPA: glycerate kinase, partial [Phycisphaerae bacterium]|nr:glycerate kinase [Phycisphaerae bacterium]
CLGGRLTSGAQAIIDFIGLEEKCRGADLILTGEGCFDEQSLQGKSLNRVGEMARRLGIPLLVVAGRIELDRTAWRGLVADAEVSRKIGPSAANAVAAAATAVVRRACPHVN